MSNNKKDMQELQNRNFSRNKESIKRKEKNRINSFSNKKKKKKKKINTKMPRKEYKNIAQGRQKRYYKKDQSNGCC